jgi:hypothetical protein
MNIEKIATEILSALGDPLTPAKTVESVTVNSTFNVDFTDNAARHLEDILKRIDGFTGFQPFVSVLQVQSIVNYDPAQTTPVKIQTTVKNALKRLNSRDLKINNNNVKFVIKK